MSRTIVGLVFHAGTEELRTCLHSVEPASDLLIVVLDASPVGSARGVIGDRCDVVWMDGSRNAGYAWGLQEIAREWVRPGDVFVAANSDVCFLDDSLKRLVGHAVELGGVCYPLQLDETRSPARYNLQGQLRLRESIARWWGPGRRRLRVKLDALIGEASGSQRPVKLPRAICGSGAVIAMTHEIWQESGGLDPRFFLFSEDKDLGTTLERLGIDAYLCGDCPVVHEGGFRGRGVTAAGTTEALVSEQLYWRKAMRSPTAVVVGIQTLGLSLRIVSCFLRRRSAARAVYARALSYRLTHLSERSAAPKGEDGFRISVLSQPEGNR